MELSCKRHFPRRIALHLLGEYILPLVGTIAAFTMVSLLLAIFDDLPDFSGKNVPLMVTVKYFFACIPTNLVMILPFSSLLAISFMTMILDKNNELTAVRSAGISLFSAALPIMFTSLLLCASIVALNEVIIPITKEYVADVQAQYIEGKSKKKDYKAEHLAFYSLESKRHWFFAEFSRYGKSKGVVVRQLSDDGRTVFILSSEFAEYKHAEKENWIFTNASVTDYRYQEDGVPVPQPPRFHQQMALSYSETPKDIYLQSMDYEKLPLTSLSNLKRSGSNMEKKVNQLVSSLYIWHFFSPLSAVIATLLGYTLTMAGARRSAAGGFVLAVIIFMGYILLAQFALSLGKNGILPPWIAGSGATIIAMGLVSYLAYRKQ